MSVINVCKEIACPYYRSSGSSGCTFYTYAHHCHLLPREGVMGSEYFLYAEEVDVPTAKRENEEFFVNNELYQRHIHLQQNVEGWKEVMEFPNRIIELNGKQD